MLRSLASIPIPSIAPFCFCTHHVYKFHIYFIYMCYICVLVSYSIVYFFVKITHISNFPLTKRICYSYCICYPSLSNILMLCRICTILIQFSSVQLLSHVQLFATPWTAACQASLSITNSWSPPKPTSTESVMPSNHLILCHPLLLLPSIFPSIRVFSNESALRIRWPKCWSFSLSINPSNEYSGLISFRMDWLDLPAVQVTLKSLL